MAGKKEEDEPVELDEEQVVTVVEDAPNEGSSMRFSGTRVSAASTGLGLQGLGSSLAAAGGQTGTTGRSSGKVHKNEGESEASIYRKVLNEVSEWAEQQVKKGKDFAKHGILSKEMQASLAEQAARYAQGKAGPDLSVKFRPTTNSELTVSVNGLRGGGSEVGFFFSLRVFTF